MSSQDDTARLLDDTGTSPELRSMLEAAVADEPSVAASARMMASFDAIAANGANGAAGAIAAPSSIGTWVGLVVASLVAVALVAYWLAADGGVDDGAEATGVAYPSSPETPAVVAPGLVDSSAPAVPLAVPSAPKPAAAVPLAPEPVMTTPVAPAVVTPPVALGLVDPPDPPAPAVAPRPVSKRARVSGPKQAASEVSLIKAARAALRARNYAGALARAKRHAAAYRRGDLAEERETIAIEALIGLGHRDAARARLDRFTRDYPASGYRRRLRALVSPGPQ